MPASPHLDVMVLAYKVYQQHYVQKIQSMWLLSLTSTNMREGMGAHTIDIGGKFLLSISMLKACNLEH